MPNNTSKITVDFSKPSAMLLPRLLVLVTLMLVAITVALMKTHDTPSESVGFGIAVAISLLFLAGMYWTAYRSVSPMTIEVGDRGLELTDHDTQGRQSLHWDDVQHSLVEISDQLVLRLHHGGKTLEIQ